MNRTKRTQHKNNAFGSPPSGRFPFLFITMLTPLKQEVKKLFFSLLLLVSLLPPKWLASNLSRQTASFFSRPPLANRDLLFFKSPEASFFLGRPQVSSCWFLLVPPLNFSPDFWALNQRAQGSRKKEKVACLLGSCGTLLR